MADRGGRGALVTGGSRGIGRAIVERLSSDGARVLFSYARDQTAAEAVVAAVAARGGIAQAVRADLAVLADITSLFEQAERWLSGLDVVVGNAGIGLGGRIAEITEATYDTVMNVNAKGTFFTLQEAARRLRDGGRIVTVSSINTVLPVPGNAVYSASKAAVEQFTAVAARELGGRAITVNSVSPGATDTDLLRGVNPPEVLAAMPAMSPLGRLGQPADIADVVAFLVSDDARWVTGQNLRVGEGLG